MITIGDRVRHAIDDVSRDEFELALEHASIGLDVTSKRYYSAARSGRATYKKLLHEYAWLLELMALCGLNLQESKFGNYPLLHNSEPSFADLVYHVVRCSLIHEEGLPPSISFTERDVLRMGHGSLVLPRKLIWGLLSVIVFCPVNRDQRTADGYWLSIFDERFIINESWGREDLARAAYEKKQPIRVALNWPFEPDAQQAISTGESAAQPHG